MHIAVCTFISRKSFLKSHSSQPDRSKMQSQRIFVFKRDDDVSESGHGGVTSHADDRGDTDVSIIICEVVDADYSCFTWPCAAVMGQYIWHHRYSFRGKTLLEISSGTGLPGILAAKVGGSVILSEYALNPGAIERCREQAQVNQVAVQITGIIWGQVTKALLDLPFLDYIILSDVFYEPRNFGHVLFTIRFLLDGHTRARCFFSYQVRDDNWNIHFLLGTFALKCCKIPLERFAAAGRDIAGSSLPGSSQVELYECMKT